MTGVQTCALPILPYQQPKHTISYDEAAAACGRKGKGWHLMTNTEFVYLLHEAEELGHTIGGNTNYGSNSKNEQESGVVYDSAGRTLTECDPHNKGTGRRKPQRTEVAADGRG